MCDSMSSVRDHYRPEEHIFCCDDYQIQSFREKGKALVKSCKDKVMKRKKTPLNEPVPKTKNSETLSTFTYQEGVEQNNVQCVLVPSTFFEVKDFESEGLSTNTTEINNETLNTAETNNGPIHKKPGTSLNKRKTQPIVDDKHKVKVKRLDNLEDFMKVTVLNGGARIFQCTHCEKEFKNSYELGRHVRVHTGEKPYKCTYCSKAFSLTSNLYKHVRSHTREKSRIKILTE
ncbi:predicted protein [Nematostella vectensis]|uniref:C2H2-type domain-containing protein n=1 Tax=Nematostella vectensis TaxID=45351 RepID=A7SFL3_NEMVE|nr:predicted protein [Nematostella vectensis]|eukprot:XP_001629580.1 predicted protein [Nematostella vectensis]